MALVQMNKQQFKRNEFVCGQTVPFGGTFRCTTCGHLQGFDANERFCACAICGLYVRTWLAVKARSRKARTAEK